MIGTGFGFIGSPFATGLNGAPTTGPGTTTTPGTSSVGNTLASGTSSLANGGQGAPILPQLPNAVSAMAGTGTADNQTDGERTPDNPQGLTQEEQAVVAELKRIDAEVRRHEQAHMNAGGQYAGQASYTYETGPDGGRYAVAGEVPIDTAPVPDDPEATIDKMEVVIRAALAPAEPSAQDQRVAAGARQTIVAAQAELRAIEREEFEARLNGENPDAPSQANGANSGNATGLSGLVSSVYNTVSRVGERNNPRESIAV
ncbi:MAG: putative metalloprotease CJM1_0395 family protein [Pseudomonadota bacterium]